MSGTQKLKMAVTFGLACVVSGGTFVLVFVAFVCWLLSSGLYGGGPKDPAWLAALVLAGLVHFLVMPSVWTLLLRMGQNLPGRLVDSLQILKLHLLLGPIAIGAAVIGRAAFPLTDLDFPFFFGVMEPVVVGWMQGLLGVEKPAFGVSGGSDARRVVPAVRVRPRLAAK